MSDTSFEVVIVGGGPAGLSAALSLGRGCRKVLLCDAGPRRNAAAEGVHNFVTRDGIPPDEFRAIARQQLAPYDVTFRDTMVQSISGDSDAFSLTLADGAQVSARRVLLALGMVDQMLDLPGFARLWGHSVFICPYCHGWEVRHLRWGVLATTPPMLEHALFLRNWSPSLTVFTSGAFTPSADERARLAGVALDERPIRALLGETRLEALEMQDGARVPLEVMFARPPQRQTQLVTGLGLDLDDMGYVRIDAQYRTSRPGLFAAGDLTTMMQAAIGAATAGTVAGTMINHSIVMAPKP